jgi:anthraniloyl-CoA monooxygenase
VLAAYEDVRRVDVARIQNAARNAMEWFEVVGTRYADTLEPEQFMYSMLTRSQRISHENLRLRDRVWLEGFERWFAERAGAEPMRRTARSRRRCSRPSGLRGLTLRNRIVVSPMAMYSATDGRAGRFPPRASRRARHGRCRPRLPRNDLRLARRRASRPAASACGTTSRQQAFQRIVDFRPPPDAGQDRPPARPCRAQGRHEARLGGHRPAARRGRLAADLRLRPALSRPFPDAARNDPRGHGPRHPTTSCRPPNGPAIIGFDILELHAAHGYLLSSFLSPLTNTRTDGYGGDHAARARFPLEVFHAIRRVWPAGQADLGAPVDA